MITREGRKDAVWTRERKKQREKIGSRTFRLLQWHREPAHSYSSKQNQVERALRDATC